jgi:hypothetical protein
VRHHDASRDGPKDLRKVCEQLFKHSDVTTAAIAVVARQRNLGRLPPQRTQQQPGTRVWA